MSAPAGHLLVAGCLRPWAERLVDLLSPQPGETCLDLCSESGAVASLLRRASGPTGRVVAAVEPGAADLDGLAAAGSAPLAADPARLPLCDGAADVVVSLFGLAHLRDPGAAVAEAVRVTRPGGRLAVAGWAGPGGAPHEAALDAALQRCLGVRSGFIAAALGFADRLEAARRWGGVLLRAERLRDVVRFDGPQHLWAALVDERPVAAEVAGRPRAALEEARDACAASLASCTAADGTLRIPVEALVLRDGASG